VNIQFKSAKELAPKEESGIEVIYGPGKRVAFKLRWYLILFLVSTPLFLILYSIASSMVLMESSGKLVLPSREVFAQTSGRVEQVVGIDGDEASTETPILILSNLSSVANLEELIRMRKRNGAYEGFSGFETLEDILQRQALEAKQWEAKISRYVEGGITSASELRDASRQLSDANRSLLETRIRKQQWQADQHRREQEGVSEADINLARHQVDALIVKSPDAAILVEVYAQKGQWVERGEAVARIRDNAPIQVWLYISPEYAEYARKGERLSVILPNGDKVKATIVKSAERALKMPNELRQAFSGNEPGLLAMAEIEDPISIDWQIEQLPVTARFTPRWIQSIKEYLF
jgi:multidrug efflux pump subunit AcrA (membrane-fusion protein)